MYVEVTCSKCGYRYKLFFEDLYEQWKAGYEALSPENKKIATCHVESSCICGNKSRCDGPMFDYIFQLIFDSFVKVKQV